MSATLSAPPGLTLPQRAFGFVRTCFAGPLNTAITLACLFVLYVCCRPARLA
jgi:hypothetical protein